MNFHKTETAHWALLLIAVIVCMPGMESIVSGQEQPVELLEITPVAPIETAVTIDPVRFDGKGRIDRIDGMELVVGDRLQRLAVNALFYSKQGIFITRDQFEQGDVIGYLKDEKGEMSALYKLD
jgi:hypothetical protein